METVNKTLNGLGSDMEKHEGWNKKGLRHFSLE